MKDELDRLLKDHVAKRRREKDVEDAEEQDHHAFQALAVGTIEKVIAPALKALSQELTGHGHEASVSLVVGTDSYPSVHLSFRIIDQDGPDDPASASRLSFSTTTSQDKFEVRTEIWGREGKETGSHTGNPEARLIADVDAGWVNAQGLAFVRCVLDRA